MRIQAVQQKLFAFTVIEILIIVANIGILVAIAMPNFMNTRISAKVSHSRAELRTYVNTHQMYFMDQNDLTM